MINQARLKHELTPELRPGKVKLRPKTIQALAEFQPLIRIGKYHLFHAHNLVGAEVSSAKIILGLLSRSTALSNIFDEVLITA